MTQETSRMVAGGMGRRAIMHVVAAGGIAAAVPGCSTPSRGPAVPLGSTTQATVLGIPNERFFPFYGTEPMELEFSAAMDRLRRAQGLAPNALLPEVQLLAVSGGGENGAFGAGVLCGWTEYGNRPVFELVTGVSTGALTAPFAYLGSSYDPQLRAVYTELTASHVLERRGLTAAIFNDAMADNAPLFRTISIYLNNVMLAALGKACEEGDFYLLERRISTPDPRDLEHRRHRQERASQGTGDNPAHPSRLRCNSRCISAYTVRCNGKWGCVSGIACGRRSVRAGLSLPSWSDATTARAHGGRPALGTGEGFAGHCHHDRRQRHQRRHSNVQRNPTRRYRFQLGVYLVGFHQEAAGTLRRPPWLRVGEATADGVGRLVSNSDD
jgi:Patatin-like phospholipase